MDYYDKNGVILKEGDVVLIDSLKYKLICSTALGINVGTNNIFPLHLIKEKYKNSNGCQKGLIPLNWIVNNEIILLSSDEYPEEYL